MLKVITSLTCALIISIAGAGSVRAADLLAKAPPPAAYDWSGFYIGGHAGGAWQDTTFSDPGAFSILNNCCLAISESGLPGGATNATASRFFGGVQAGWMYQIGRLVVGTDIDFSDTRLTGGGSGSFPALAGGTSFANETYSVQTRWTATSTGTVGIAQGRWMLYGKAGTAWADEKYGLGIAGSYFGTPFSFAAANSSQIVTGWTAGVGLKFAITDNVFLDAEYDFLDFGSNTPHMSGAFTATPVLFGTGPGATFDPIFNQNISEFKVGLNYKFAPWGAGSSPGADMPTKAPIAIAYDWSGFYIGGHVGGGWQNTRFSDPSAENVLTNCCFYLGAQGNPGAATDATGSGGLAGAQAGWMYQVGKVVVGADFDISGTHINGDGSNTFPALIGGTESANETYQAVEEVSSGLALSVILSMIESGDYDARVGRELWIAI